MNMATNDRHYELILFGATGYTGRLTAEHIATHLPSDLRWAVSGRSSAKLEALVGEIKSLNPDRSQPAIEIAQLNEHDLDALAKKTKLLISVVGPYSLYGEPVVAACAQNGTHYLDVTGETPWVYDIIQRYHSVAVSTGAIIIPQMGIESAPADLLSWSLVSCIQANLHVPTREVVLSMHKAAGSLSGGTSATILALFTKYSLSDLSRSNAAYALSPIPAPKPTTPLHRDSRLTGARHLPTLGTLTVSPTHLTDRSIVHRSWGLLGGSNFYGPNFQYSGYLRVRNSLIGMLIHLGLGIGMLALILPPVRWLLRLFMYAPGMGADRAQTKKEILEYRAVATADTKAGEPLRYAKARLRHEGGMYYLTGMFLAEAAFVILRGGDCEAKKMGGGVLTPATLGVEFVERLNKGGCRIETSMLD